MWTSQTAAEGYQRSHTAQWTGRLCNKVIIVKRNQYARSLESACDVKLKIRLVIRYSSVDRPIEEQSCPIWNDGTLGFFEARRPNNDNKMSNDSGSVTDPKIVKLCVSLATASNSNLLVEIVGLRSYY